VSNNNSLLPVEKIDVESVASNHPLYAMTLFFCLTAFTSAFLLFQVQPIIAKFILPWFGSSPGVWATCMLFFQLLLLGGYAYTHLIVSRLQYRRQAMLHCALLVIALLFLPIAPDPLLKPVSTDAPVAQILLVLMFSVGVPYMLLSASGPLLQSWLAHIRPERSPYRLYAVSNIGSLLGLLSYPFVFEPNFTLGYQSLLWSVGYFVFALFCAGCAWFLLPKKVNIGVRDSDEKNPPKAVINSNRGATVTSISGWLVLSACGSALLLATTNQLSIDVAVVPFLWVLPLSIYLLSFILCFDSDRWYFRPLFFAALPLVLMNTVRVLYEGVYLDFTEQIVSYCATLFVCCMCLHGELSKRKPDPAQLTLFYLYVSIGGVVGGAFVALFSPVFFSGFYEYSILISICAGLIALIMLRLHHLSLAQSVKSLSTKLSLSVGCGAVLMALWLAFDKSTWLGEGRSTSTEILFESWYQQLLVVSLITIVIIQLVVEWLRRKTKLSVYQWWISPHNLLVNVGRSSLILALVVLVASLVWVAREEERRQIFRDRNFYGVLAIREYNASNSNHLLGLRDGRISHGEQLQKHKSWPTSYYGPRSGAGLALRLHPFRAEANRQFRVGIIGLGVGTLAAYANSTVSPDSANRYYVKKRQHIVPDYMRFYELNPLVSDWAENKFSFLNDARERGADVEVLMGDARLVLERQLAQGKNQNFDVFILDAFSSDSIPLHLLTKEALDIYWRHLGEDGVLALHVSNRFLDIKPVVRRLALEMKKELIYTKNKTRNRRSVSGASWMIMSNNKGFMSLKEVHKYERKLPALGPLWTDDFSSLFDVLKPGH